ncbi:MAG: ABC transporter ATP-binding protein [Treponemataceae bacterium]|nr:ABC transporter ATP-binding protein [Treponemataceae bacterium]
MYVELKNINKTFGNFKASNNVNFGIEKGKLVALLGPSGSGKTTILRMIAGLEHQDSGDILIDGKIVNDIHPSERGIGFVFQNYALFRYMTVEQNIAFGLKVKKADKEFTKKRVAELIDLVGLKGLEKRYPSQLSGGQKQRVAFARALAPNPQLLLLDEPFAAIDAKIRKELRTWLREMITKLGITSIFVTHDQDEAIEISDEIIVTNKGSIEQVGSPMDIYQNPKTPFTVQFFGNISYLKDYRQFKSFEQVDGFEKALVRPEFVRVTKADHIEKFPISVSDGIVKSVFFRGTHTELWIEVNGETVIATRRLENRPVSVGEKVHILLYKVFLIKNGELIQLENLLMKEDVTVL